MEDTKSDAAAELAAMKEIAEALSQLDEASILRVLRWVGDRYGPTVGASPAVPARTEETAFGPTGKYNDLADLYSAASPERDPEKALVVGYWFQTAMEMSDFDSQRVNKELKNLGYGVSNITQAFNSLIRRKPQLVIQTRKGGSAQQARKRYRLTSAGTEFVEQMIGSHEMGNY